jgi:hypothetical protein
MSSSPTGPRPPLPAHAPRTTAFEVGALLETAVALLDLLKWRRFNITVTVDPEQGINLQIPSTAGDDRARWVRSAAVALEGDHQAAQWDRDHSTDMGCYRLGTTWAETPVHIFTLIPRQDAARLGVPYRTGVEGTSIGGGRS